MYDEKTIDYYGVLAILNYKELKEIGKCKAKARNAMLTLSGSTHGKSYSIKELNSWEATKLDGYGNIELIFREDNVLINIYNSLIEN